MRSGKKIPGVPLLLAVLSFVASSLAAEPQPRPEADTLRAVQAAEQKGGFGRAESITGTISLVKPDEGLLIVTERGPGQPASLMITGATMVTKNPDGSTTKTDAGVSAESGPGETDYHFRVTNSTLIRVNGRSVALSNLARLEDKKVTVHFIPERNGNFAKTIEVRP